MQGVLPEQPDAWIWLGDLAYMDLPPVDCEFAANTAHPACNCPSTWLTHPPQQCYAGDIDNARIRARDVITSDGYAAFLEYMCPGSLALGLFPPPGRDATICPRPILGTYDDHDYGWNNGNRRLPRKDAAKQVRSRTRVLSSASPALLKPLFETIVWSTWLFSWLLRRSTSP